MIGAIIGDIVGSIYEFDNHKSKDFELFGEGCFPTDDSIMTLAIGKAIKEGCGYDFSSSLSYKSITCNIQNDEFADDKFIKLFSDNAVKYMREIGRQYPRCGYGGGFERWIHSDTPKPYNSYGNGAAMRISAVGYAAADLTTVEELSYAVTCVTHNHPEGLKGAEAVATAIWLARKGVDIKELRKYIEYNYYDIKFTIPDLVKKYHFNESCQGTVPPALLCFFESESFEDAIRTAISVGGDSDTLAAITGGIAEAYYGVPRSLEQKALTYFDDRLRAVYEECRGFNKVVDG